MDETNNATSTNFERSKDMSLVQNDTGERMAAEREGFYEKMWKDFVSLQRGDARLLCEDAARYRWLRDGNNDLEGLLPLVSGSDLDAEIDAAMTANATLRGAEPALPAARPLEDTVMQQEEA